MKTKERIYIAYGSNMDFKQMEYRCPDAIFMGVGVIEDYELLFKGSLTGSYATIEKKKGSTVPVYLWSISARDEKSLDRYEGCPTFYYKKTLPVRVEGGSIDGMVYIMHEERRLGIPTGQYYNVLYDGYKRFGFDTKILKNALQKSVEGINEEKHEWGKDRRRFHG